MRKRWMGYNLSIILTVKANCLATFLKQWLRGSYDVLGFRNFESNTMLHILAVSHQFS